MPDVIKVAGHDWKTRVMGSREYEKELKKKLVEEAKEVEKASKEELINELSDVLELAKSIATHYKIPFSKVEKFQEEKRKKRGGFKKKLFLLWSTGKPGK